jgi:hypothetical protein
MVAVASLEWQDVIDGNFPSTSRDTRLRSAVVQAAQALDTPPYNTPKEKLTKAMDLVLTDKIQAHADGTYTVTGSKPYEVTDRCACYQGQHGQSKWCKHLVAIEIWKRTQERLYGTVATSAATSTANGNGQDTTWVDRAKQHPVLTTTTPTIPPQFVTEIKGKQFVQYAGLLAMAHERGLQSLSAHFISVTPELALAEATAEFTDGTTFSECADATPENVNAHVRKHFARCALTRAKARALRDALNVSMCSVEEAEV